MIERHRLNGLDAGFLALELAEQPMHKMALAVLRPVKDDFGTPIPVTLASGMSRSLSELVENTLRRRGEDAGTSVGDRS